MQVAFDLADGEDQEVIVAVALAVAEGVTVPVLLWLAGLLCVAERE